MAWTWDGSGDACPHVWVPCTHVGCVYCSAAALCLSESLRTEATTLREPVWKSEQAQGAVIPQHTQHGSPSSSPYVPSMISPTFSQRLPLPQRPVPPPSSSSLPHQARQWPSESPHLLAFPQKTLPPPPPPAARRGEAEQCRLRAPSGGVGPRPGRGAGPGSSLRVGG